MRSRMPLFRALQVEFHEYLRGGGKMGCYIASSLQLTFFFLAGVLGIDVSRIAIVDVVAGNRQVCARAIHRRHVSSDHVNSFLLGLGGDVHRETIKCRECFNHSSNGCHYHSQCPLPPSGCSRLVGVCGFRFFSHDTGICVCVGVSLCACVCSRKCLVCRGLQDLYG